MPKKTFTVALAGNPNSGKTTVFNNLTGARQKVGNWPGVTVEKKEGHLNHNGYDIVVVDLPGTYSLTPYSIEEIVARDFVLDEKPDVVVAIIDASNLERNLYLSTQIRELDTKVIFALNMIDVARENAIKINTNKLSELLAVPVVSLVGSRNEGTDRLLETIISIAESDKGIPDQSRRVSYGHEIEKAISELNAFIREKTGGKPAVQSPLDRSEAPGRRQCGEKTDHEQNRNSWRDDIREGIRPASKALRFFPRGTRNPDDGPAIRIYRGNNRGGPEDRPTRQKGHLPQDRQDTDEPHTRYPYLHSLYVGDVSDHLHIRRLSDGVA
jgi:small GTP-binding protein